MDEFFRVGGALIIIAWMCAGAYSIGRIHGRRSAPSTSHDWDVMPDYAKNIEDYDRREAAGEDVSGEMRPRFPGGSDF